MSEEEIKNTYPLERGVLQDVPVWENHARGKNWMARIKKDPRAPGGLERKFFEKSHSPEEYYITEGLRVGDPVEFAGDYITGGGNRYKRRYYGVCTAITCTEATFEWYETPSKATKAAAEFVAPTRREQLEQEKERLTLRLIAIETELKSIT